MASRINRAPFSISDLQTTAEQPRFPYLISAMVTLGVTGGIGSGKSTACRYLEELGAHVFYADDVAKQLMVENKELRQEITKEFGPKSYTAAGALNRKYLADQVFNDEKKLQTLNKLVHRRVREAFYEVHDQAQAKEVSLLVEEAALIFEANIDEQLDYVAVVDAPEELRIQRVVERDGTDASKVRARIQHQLPAAEKRRRADFVLDNSSSVENLRRQVKQLYQKLVD